jgi:hypothetical protein
MAISVNWGSGSLFYYCLRRKTLTNAWENKRSCIMKIGTLTTGAATVDTFKLNYVPQYLYYIAATQLTGIKVTVAGDGVVLDLDANGLGAVDGIGRYGQVANSYLIPLATALIPNKVVEIQTTNSAAQTPALYGFSLQNSMRAEGVPISYVRSVKQIALAGSAATFENFAQLGFSSPTTSDIINIGYVDGHVEQFESTELLGIITLEQNEVDAYVINNLAQMIDWVKIIPSTDRTCYITSFVIPGTL